MAGRDPGFERVNYIIPKSIHSLGPEVENKYCRHYVVWHWQDIVGEAIAHNVRAVCIDRNDLLLFSHEATWRNEIMMSQSDIIAKVNRYAGGELVKSISFVSDWRNKFDLSDAEIHRPNLLSDVGDGGGNGFQKKIRRALPDGEMLVEAKSKCCNLADGKLSSTIQGLYLKNLQLNSWRQQKGYHHCKSCGLLCEPDGEYCFFCTRKIRQEKLSKIRHLLSDLPWVRYADISKYVECTPQMVNAERAAMVQKLAAELKPNDETSLKAKTLVMLYRCLPPEKLTDNIIKRTLRKLRFDMLPLKKNSL